MPRFAYFSGTLTTISDFPGGNEQMKGCTKLMSVEESGGNSVHFVVSPSTYIVHQRILVPGDPVTGFYDTMVPVPLIYPPQYRAVVMTKDSRYQNVKVDYFDTQLTSSDGMLKLNLSPLTRIVLENGQPFTESPSNHYLIVVYGVTTRSIPAQTTPFEIIVMCRYSAENGLIN